MKGLRYHFFSAMAAIIIFAAPGIVAAQDTDPPVITLGPVVTEITASSAMISWVTDEPSDSRVEYGLDESYGQEVYLDEMLEDHSVVLSELVAATLYHFRVSSTDSLGNGPTYSGDSTFTTAGDGVWEVEIVPEIDTLIINETEQFEATLYDPMGEEVDTTFTWSLAGDEIGVIDENGTFTALYEGEGFVIASVGELADSATVVVIAEPGELGEWEIVVTPADTTVVLGAVVQFSAEVFDTSGALVDTSVNWSLGGQNIGVIDENGLFTALGIGFGSVWGSLGEWFGYGLITVLDSLSDTTGVDTAFVIRYNPAGHIADSVAVYEGGPGYIMGGFPFPMNLLNSGRITFPINSLHFNIRLTISVPDFFEIQGDSINMPEGMVNGVSFEVSVGDSVIDPFYFDSPVQVTIPFKRGLLQHLGIEPTDLGMFFYDSLGYDTSGITNVVVDSVANLIYGNIHHLSDVAIADEGVVWVDGEAVRLGLPAQLSLAPNYPNPFNATTTITFHLPQTSLVTLSVYNLLGQEVAVIASGVLPAGEHRFLWQAKSLASGLYFIRLEDKSGFALTRKALLIK